MTALECDSGGRLVTITAPGGIAECREYDNANNLTATVQNCVAGQSATADRNVRTEYGYDGAGRPIWTRGPTGEVARTLYEARGLVDRTIVGCFAGGAYSTTTCDPFSAGTPWRNRVTAYGYDDRGRQVTVTDPLGIVTRTEYNSASRPFKTTRNYVSGGPTNASTNVASTTEYDAAGRVTATLDPLGRKVAFAYDGLGRVTTQTANVAGAVAPANVATSYSYDAAGRVLAMTDPLGKVWQSAYNGAGWQTSATDPTNRTTTYTYDGLGRRVGTIDPLNHERRTLYDPLGRVTQGVVNWQNGAVEPADGADRDLVTATEYDAAGRRTALVDAGGRRTTYAYDGLDRPTGATHSVTGAVGHGWDLAGRRTSVAVSGGPGSGAPAVGYGYDDAGRLTAVTKGGVNYATATYDPAGRLGTVTRYNGGAAGATTTYGYDAADRLTGLTTTQLAATLGQFTYAYARTGQVTQATEAVGVTSRAVGYSYDGLLRLTGATSPGGTTYAYGYDPAGNRTSVAVNGGAPQTRTYDAADQVVGWTYDGAGNLLSDGTTTYTWDPLGRLASTTVGGTTTTYGYDGDHALALRAAGGSTTRYSIDTQGGLAERLGAVTTTGGGPAASAWYVRGFGGELGRETSSGTAWYLADRLGSVRAEYGATAGGLTARTDYDPFGGVEGGPAPSDYGFTGEPQVAGGGLVQLRARWYQPGSGQFTSRDPWWGEKEEPQTLAPYAYAHNDPLNGVDPTGRWRWQHSTTGHAYHELVEDIYLAFRDPFHAHAEYNDFIVVDNIPGGVPSRGPKVDLLNSGTGDVWEIEPIGAEALALFEATQYTNALRERGIDSLRRTGKPGRLRSVPGRSKFPYNWNHVDWHLGIPTNFSYFPIVIEAPPLGMAPNKDYSFLAYADLVTISPAPGIVVFWLQPKPQVEWADFAQKVPNYDLARPRGWRYGDAKPPTKRPDPSTAPAPPGPPPPPRPGQLPLPWPQIPRLGGGYGAGINCTDGQSGGSGSYPADRPQFLP